MWGQLSTTCSNVLKQPNGELLVAVNHNQLRTMPTETVDPIDWSHPPSSWAVPPERHVHSINRCNLSGTRTCNRSMRGPQQRGNHLANAATQGFKQTSFKKMGQKYFKDICILLFSQLYCVIIFPKNVLLLFFGSVNQALRLTTAESFKLFFNSFTR